MNKCDNSMMDYNEIEQRKPFYKIKAPLREHLKHYARLENLPIKYEDLTHYQELIPMFDRNDEPTLWYGALYSQTELDFLQEQLIRVYELLIGDGDKIPYLKIGSIEFCSFGNSKPFRIKVVNEVNDNHDYFYIKRADASRIYGLELEEIFSPDKILFLVDGATLVEEHIVGVPCDEFIFKNSDVKISNRLRFAKEFVKFNERCFTRLLGDMRAYNFVVEIIQDFDNIQYRFRPIDFDQQNYEGRKNIYLPQFYVDNKELVELAQEVLTTDIANQYMREERVAMKKRFFTRIKRTRSLFRRIRKDNLSTLENRNQLSKELKKYHNDNSGFVDGMTMGDILLKHMELKLGVKIFEHGRSSPPANEKR